MRYAVCFATVVLLLTTCAVEDECLAQGGGNMRLSAGSGNTILFETEDGAKVLPGLAIGATYWVDESDGRLFFWDAYQMVDDEPDYNFMGVGWRLVSGWWGFDISAEGALALRNFDAEVDIGFEGGFRWQYSLNSQPYNARTAYVNLDGKHGITFSVEFLSG